MVIRLLLDGANTAGISVQLSPLAELCAALHAFSNAEHHPASAAWVDRLRTARTEALDQVYRWSPLWGSQKAEFFYPLRSRSELALQEELAEVAKLPIDVFVGMSAKSLTDGDPEPDYARLFEDSRARKRFMDLMTRMPEERWRLARELVSDPERSRSQLLDFLQAFGDEWFLRDWDGHRRELRAERDSRQAAVKSRGWASFADFGASTDAGEHPRQLMFDKLSNRTLNMVDRPCVLIPSWHIGSHIIIKHSLAGGDATPVSIQYNLGASRARAVSVLVQQRLQALDEPVRLRICRLILRTPKTTVDIARELRMSEPQASRHLRRLRETGLATVRRDGRMVFYSLDVESVGRLGFDLLDALRR
ncbi:MAG: transcriptional regulator [Frankiales bacterium]|nr:transcriptional regulator [Frankiales bacterium]